MISNLVAFCYHSKFLCRDGRRDYIILPCLATLMFFQAFLACACLISSNLVTLGNKTGREPHVKAHSITIMQGLWNTIASDMHSAPRRLHNGRPPPVRQEFLRMSIEFDTK